jgi:transcriptional regulator with XRE-family HTH domain
MTPRILTFGTRMRYLRDTLGLSLSKLAELSGVSRGYLYLVEKGTSCPTLDKVEAIAQVLNVTPSQLIGDNSGDLFADEVKLLNAYRIGDLKTIMQLALARVEVHDGSA